MRDMPTAVVVASQFMYHAVAIQRMLSTNTFRIYTNQDMIGVELGGSLKNPLAIGIHIHILTHVYYSLLNGLATELSYHVIYWGNAGAGILEGMSMGYNTKAAYVTRSSLELMELCRYVNHGLSSCTTLIVLSEPWEASPRPSVGCRE
jgi:glycerol-3-phosphate dehydrogenase (NAD+)